MRMFRVSSLRPGRLTAGAIALFAICACVQAASSFADDAPKKGEPTDEKARKTYAGAGEFEKHRDYSAAISDYRKATKQDGGHCRECLSRAFLLAARTS